MNLFERLLFCRTPSPDVMRVQIRVLSRRGDTNGGCVVGCLQSPGGTHDAPTNSATKTGVS